MTQIKPCFSEVSEFIEVLKNQDLPYKLAETTEPTVSIISSFYNVSEEYFLETNRSIQNQTFQNYEWIIADDCSTDPVAIELFSRLHNINPKIKTVKRSVNGGLAAGRNTAIKQARGQYLFFMDTDDLLDPTTIEKCILFLATHLDFSFVNTYSLGFQSQEYWWDKGFAQSYQFIEENLVTGRLLYRKKDFDLLGGFDETLRFYEDWERWLRAIAAGQRGWTIPEFLDCYRRTQSGLLATSRAKVFEEQAVKTTIQTRYRDCFERKSLPKCVVERPMFDLDALRTQLPIKNPINATNPNKRVLCWVPHLEVGGADKFNLDLLTGLKRLGYDITIVTTVESQHPWFAAFYRLTPDIFHLPRLLHYAHWLAFARYLLKSRHIDLCFISNTYYVYPLLPILRHEFSDIAFIDYIHTEDIGWRAGGYPRISCQYSPFLDAHLTTSDYLAKQLIRINPATADKLQVCYINVDTDFWQVDKQKRRQIRDQMGVDDETPILIFPARMTAQKRPLFFLDIVSELVAKGLSFSVLMLGSGDLIKEVTTQIDQKALSSVVRVLPFVTPESMVAYYSAADVVLLPSAYEGISLVMYEAMSMGLPVVASDVGGQRELLVEGSGFLLPLGEADEAERHAYTEVLEPLLKDPQPRSQVGSTARSRINNHFQLEEMVVQMDRTIQDVIARRRETIAHTTSTDNVSTSTLEITLCEESLLWIQEFLAIDRVWHDFQSTTKQLDELRQWTNQLTKERDLYKNQSAAWQQVAKKAQISLNQLESRSL